MLLLPAILAAFLFFQTELLPVASSAHAQTPNLDPKIESVVVSATVADNLPPTTPILIAPEDNELVTTGYVTFIWWGSTDENGIKEYDLSLDGSIYLKALPPHDSETDLYELTHDEINNRFTLKVKKIIPDGLHAWKIRANDNLNNGSDSATWSFTIDTQAPSFVLTRVGEHHTSISAQDLETLPPLPLELEDNSPQLIAQGEANSDVELLVSIPGDPTQSFTNTTDINGNWGQKLGILPRDTIITLDFTITDQAGLVSILNGVKFLIKQKVITYPPTEPSPTAITQVTPSPGFSPPPSPLPASPTPSPLISIPLLPPIEIAHEIIQESFEHLPAPIKTLVASVSPGTRAYLVAKSQQLAPILAPLILLLLALLIPLAMLKRFGQRLSPHLIYRTLQALGFIPTGVPGSPPQGLAYERTTQNPAAFTEIELFKNGELFDSVVTDDGGVYRGLRLKIEEETNDNYELRAHHPDYRFPSNQLAPQHLNSDQFYRGETFNPTSNSDIKFPALKLIPLDPLESHSTKNILNRLVTSLIPDLKQLKRVYSWLLLPIFILIGLITIIFPTPANITTLIIYLLMVIKKAIAWFSLPNLQGQVVVNTNKANTNENVIIEIFNHNLPHNSPVKEYSALIQTEIDGQFELKLPTGQYRLRATDQTAVWTTQGSSQSSPQSPAEGQNETEKELMNLHLEAELETVLIALQTVSY